MIARGGLDRLADRPLEAQDGAQPERSSGAHDAPPPGHAPLRAAVDGEHRASRVARRVAREIQRSANDLLGVAGPARRERACALREHVHVPGLGDRRQERAWHDRVDPHLGPKAWARPTVMALTPAFAAAYGHDVARRAHGAGARDVDDRAAAGLDHPLADERREPERAFQVDGDHLVEQLLGDGAELVVLRRDAGVVDEYVDAPEVAVDVCRPARRAPPSARRGRRARSRCRPRRAAPPRPASQASALRLTTTTSAPACANPRAIASPSPRVPPVTTATRPERSNGAVRRMQRLGWLVQSGPPPRGVGAGEREGRDAVRAAVFGHVLADAAGVEQEVEVSEDFPDDQQWLFGDGPRRPQIGRDLVRGGRGRRRSVATMRSQRRSVVVASAARRARRGR